MDDEIGPSVRESLEKLATKDLPKVQVDQPEEPHQEALPFDRMEVPAEDEEESSDNA